MLSNRNIKKLKKNGLGFTIRHTKEYSETYREWTGGVITYTTIYDLSNEDRSISLLKDTGGYLSICGPMFEALLFDKETEIRWSLDAEDQMIDDIILEFFRWEPLKKDKKFWKKRAKYFEEKCGDLQHKYDMLEENVAANAENMQQHEEMFKEQKLLKEQLAKRVRDLKFLNDKYKNANLNLQIKLKDLEDEYDTLKDCHDAEVECFKDNKDLRDEHYAQISSLIDLINDDIKDLDLPKDCTLSLRMKSLMENK